MYVGADRRRTAPRWSRLAALGVPCVTEVCISSNQLKWIASLYGCWPAALCAWTVTTWLPWASQASLRWVTQQREDCGCFLASAGGALLLDRARLAALDGPSVAESVRQKLV